MNFKVFREEQSCKNEKSSFTNNTTRFDLQIMNMKKQIKNILTNNEQAQIFLHNQKIEESTYSMKRIF